MADAPFEPRVHDVVVHAYPYTVCIPAEDIDRAVSFYTAIFACRMVRDVEVDAVRVVELVLEGQDGPERTSISLVSEGFVDVEREEYPGVVFRVPALRQLHTKLVDAGVTFDQPPHQTPMGLMAVMIDSEGNRIMLLGEEQDEL